MSPPENLAEALSCCRSQEQVGTILRLAQPTEEDLTECGRILLKKRDAFAATQHLLSHVYMNFAKDTQNHFEQLIVNGLRSASETGEPQDLQQHLAFLVKNVMSPDQNIFEDVLQRSVKRLTEDDGVAVNIALSVTSRYLSSDSVELLHTWFSTLEKASKSSCRVEKAVAVLPVELCPKAFSVLVSVSPEAALVALLRGWDSFKSQMATAKDSRTFDPTAIGHTVRRCVLSAAAEVRKRVRTFLSLELFDQNDDVASRLESCRLPTWLKDASLRMDFCTLLQNLEEFAVHLVSPLLHSVVERSARFSSSIVDFLFSCLPLISSLSHENVRVRRLALDYFASTRAEVPIHLRDNEDADYLVDFITGPLRSCLDDAAAFKGPKEWRKRAIDGVATFIGSCLNWLMRQQREDHVNIIFESIVKDNLKPRCVLAFICSLQHVNTVLPYETSQHILQIVTMYTRLQQKDSVESVQMWSSFLPGMKYALPETEQADNTQEKDGRRETAAKRMTRMSVILSYMSLMPMKVISTLSVNDIVVGDNAQASLSVAIDQWFAAFHSGERNTNWAKESADAVRGLARCLHFAGAGIELEAIPSVASVLSTSSRAYRPVEDAGVVFVLFSELSRLRRDYPLSSKDDCQTALFEGVEKGSASLYEQVGLAFLTDPFQHDQASLQPNVHSLEESLLRSDIIIDGLTALSIGENRNKGLQVLLSLALGRNTELTSVEHGRCREVLSLYLQMVSGSSLLKTANESAYSESSIGGSFGIALLLELLGKRFGTREDRTVFINAEGRGGVLSRCCDRYDHARYGFVCAYLSILLAGMDLSRTKKQGNMTANQEKNQMSLLEKQKAEALLDICSEDVELVSKGALAQVLNCAGLAVAVCAEEARPALYDRTVRLAVSSLSATSPSAVESAAVAAIVQPMIFETLGNEREKTEKASSSSEVEQARLWESLRVGIDKIVARTSKQPRMGRKLVERLGSVLTKTIESSKIKENEAQLSYISSLFLSLLREGPADVKSKAQSTYNEDVSKALPDIGKSWADGTASEAWVATEATFTRLCALKTLLCLPSSASVVVHSVMKALFTEYERLSREKTLYRVMRTWSKEEVIEWSRSVAVCLVNAVERGSVRSYLEVHLVYCLYVLSQKLEKDDAVAVAEEIFFHSLRLFKPYEPQVVSSLVMVCVFLIIDQDAESFIGVDMVKLYREAAVRALRPWLNHNHNNTRALAQYAFTTGCEKTGLFLDEHDYVFLRHHPECVALRAKLTEKCFSSPFSLRVAVSFGEVLRRVSGVGPSIGSVCGETVPEGLAETVKSEVSSFISAFSKPEEARDRVEQRENSEMANFQMKIDRILDEIAGFSALPQPAADTDNRAKGGLKLEIVASLVQKAPNLAGIARTAEVLGVEKVLVNNRTKLLNDEIFQQVSVTAEKWLPIEELHIDDIPSYLVERKKMGYNVVALEQAATSVELQEYKFPEKTVVLLGEEKEGIPAHLFPFVDDCVEIPQAGVIRSLNVHVSAAILLWQCTFQAKTMLAKAT